MFYFSFAVTGRGQLKSSPRSQNHSTWTIPSLVADRGGYHPHLLLCELTCIWSLFLTMHQSRISMAVVIVCFNVLLANSITPEHISWNLLWDQRSQTNLILHEWNKKTMLFSTYLALLGNWSLFVVQMGNKSFDLFEYNLGPRFLTWINFNPSIDE